MVGDVVGCGYSAEITVVADPCLAKVLHLHHCLVRILSLENADNSLRTFSNI